MVKTHWPDGASCTLITRELLDQLVGCANEAARQKTLAEVSQRGPRAWALVRPETGQCISVFLDYEAASEERLRIIQSSGHCYDIVMLHRQTQEMLTTEECEAIDDAQNHIDGYDGEWGGEIARTLRGLLQRLG